MKITLFPVAAMLVLAGCVTGPAYTNYTSTDAACIKGDTANFLKFFSEGEAHVHIKEIDGIPTAGGSPYCLLPGRHRLGVSADNNYQNAQDYIDMEFSAGRQYLLRANLRGISFVFQLIDITNGQETKLEEFRIKAGPASQPVSIPIFIPAK